MLQNPTLWHQHLRGGVPPATERTSNACCYNNHRRIHKKFRKNLPHHPASCVRTTQRERYGLHLKLSKESLITIIKKMLKRNVTQHLYMFALYLLYVAIYYSHQRDTEIYNCTSHPHKRQNKWHNFFFNTDGSHTKATRFENLHTQ